MRRVITATPLGDHQVTQPCLSVIAREKGMQLIASLLHMLRRLAGDKVPNSILSRS